MGRFCLLGTPTSRSFNTDASDFYIQNSWKITRNLTVGFGLRYTISTPVKETNGFGVVTDISTEQYLKNREAGAAMGVPYTQPLTLVLAGGNGKGYLYNWDKNNFQPRISVAYSSSGLAAASGTPCSAITANRSSEAALR
jgi:hypothetical protein